MSRLRVIALGGQIGSRNFACRNRGATPLEQLSQPADGYLISRFILRMILQPPLFKILNLPALGRGFPGEGLAQAGLPAVSLIKMQKSSLNNVASFCNIR